MQRLPRLGPSDHFCHSTRAKFVVRNSVAPCRRWIVVSPRGKRSGWPARKTSDPAHDFWNWRLAVDRMHQSLTRGQALGLRPFGVLYPAPIERAQDRGFLIALRWLRDY